MYQNLVCLHLSSEVAFVGESIVLITVDFTFIASFPFKYDQTKVLSIKSEIAFPILIC